MEGLIYLNGNYRKHTIGTDKSEPPIHVNAFYKTRVETSAFHPYTRGRRSLLGEHHAGTRRRIALTAPAKLLRCCRGLGWSTWRVAALALGLTVFACTAKPAAKHSTNTDCATCHQSEAQKWNGSDHDRSMAEPSQATIAGRFDGRAVSLVDVIATPKRQNDQWTIKVEDGAGVRSLPVRYAFGHSPLQQYLLEADGGRLVVAPIAWDVVKHRWFDPSPEGAVGDPADPLHWSGLAGTWNHMCADCHSTDVNKSYDVEGNRYKTTFSHTDVSCTACHGQGESLVDLSSQRDEIEACAKCHSRREQIAPGHTAGAKFLDHYQVALLDGPVYYPDGQIKPGHEAFVYGSFLQSKMYQHGVRCSDCHDSHSGKLKAKVNLLCTQQCHSAGQFDTPAHHDHRPGSVGAECVNCHMPATIYMGVDARRDHHIRVPDPIASAQLGTPDACTNCHERESIAHRIRKPNSALSSAFGALVARARNRDPRAAPSLRAAVANRNLDGFRRASALALLKNYPPLAKELQVRQATLNPDPLIRTAAANTLGTWGRHLPALIPLLTDTVRAVRFAAARHLAVHNATSAAQLRPVLAEIEQASAANSDVPSTHTNLAVIHASMGDDKRAIMALRTALRLDPRFVPALRNLAVLLLRNGHRDQAEQLWQRVQLLNPNH